LPREYECEVSPQHKACDSEGRVRIKLSFPESLAGDIPFHCHLVDHKDNGMMEVLRVLPIGHQAAPRASIVTRSILPP
jgi:hypothetical protein